MAEASYVGEHDWAALLELARERGGISRTCVARRSSTVRRSPHLREHELLLCVAVGTDRTIPQRELRNNVAGVLREAEAGTTFTITVRGRAVAKLGPAEATGRRVDVDRETLLRIFRETPVDDEFARDVESLEQPIEWDD